jgi:membrane fusion protein (multidrug efflux system)
MSIKPPYARSLFIIVIVLAAVLSACSPSGRRGGGSDGSGSRTGESGAGGKEFTAEAVPREAIPVEAVELTAGRLIERIESSGTVSGIEEATVVSETQGVIERAEFELGQLVEPGDTLVQVDDEIARLNMEQAEQQLETARIDLQSRENLLERGGASRAEVLRARSNLRGAEARYRQTKKAFEDCTISSPITGYVADRGQEVSIGNYISPGTPVARIVDLSSLRMEVAVGESIVGLIEEGAEASVRVPAACEDEVHPARVVAVAAGSDPATGSFPVVIEWKNECGTRIKSGMSAQAVIEPRETEPTLILPSASIASRGGDSVVFIARSSGESSDTQTEMTADMRKVELGRRLGNRTELISGVEAGEIVILTGISGLSDGDPVEVTVVGESGSRR